MATMNQMDRLQESFERKVRTLGIITPNVFDSVERFPRVKLLDAPAINIFERCDQMFGDNWIWSTTMWNEETTFFFKDPLDATVFKLMIGYKTA